MALPRFERRTICLELVRRHTDGDVSEYRRVYREASSFAREPATPFTRRSISVWQPSGHCSKLDGSYSLTTLITALTCNAT